MYVAGIFSYEKEAPIENWLHNTVKSLIGNTINLPTDWLQLVEIHATKDWPLLFSLATQRIERERLTLPVAAFQSCGQQELKFLLNETMDKSAFYKFSPVKEKMQGIFEILIEMF